MSQYDDDKAAADTVGESSPPGIDKPSSAAFVLRGASGGAIGILIFLIFFDYRHPNPINSLFVFASPIYAFIGGIVGGVIGLILWFCRNRRQRDLKSIVRVSIGVTITLIGVMAFLTLDWLESLADDNRSRPLIDTSQSNVIIDVLAFGLIIGTLSGLMVRTKKHESPAVKNSN